MANKIYDVMILGAGPGGLAAGLYAGRSKLSCLIIEKGIDGGQIAVTHDVENYPGQQPIDGVSGQGLVAPMTAQCAKFGCDRVQDTINSCDFTGPIKKFVGNKGEYLAKAVIICTGAMTRFIGCENEAKYVGKGISYCAVCDANFFEDFEIYVSGGNGIAVEESMYLSKYARKVTMLHKGAALTCPPHMKEEVEANEKIHVMCNTEILSVGGGELLSEITVKDTVTGEVKVLKADEEDGFFGLFGFTGKKTTGMFEGILEMENGYIKTDECMRTNIPGVYAAGDVRVTPLRQVVTACSDGAIAAMQCTKYCPTVKVEE